MKNYYVYILVSKKNVTLNIGKTSDLVKRIYEHKNNLISSFTKKYNVHRLVYYEEFTDVLEAIAMEKRIKKWNRQWKIGLIEKVNGDWRDLYFEIIR